MLAKANKTGSSFKGVMQYCTHDKRAKSSDRVDYIEYLGMPVPPKNAKQAVALMVNTANNAEDLKRAAGVKATGRKSAKPVYHYTLSWHPDETPTKEQQIAAARETLEVLGLADHQVAIIGHNDEAHAHVHIVVNRIHPLTGKTASVDKDHLTLSRWVEDYEQRQGKIYTPQRIENNARRAEGEYVKHPKINTHEWRSAKQKEHWAEYHSERKQLDADKQQALDELWSERKAAISAVNESSRRANKKGWAQLYAAQKRELRQYDRSAVKRYREWRKWGGGHWFAIRMAIADEGIGRGNLVRQHEAAKAAFGERIRADKAPYIQTVVDNWQYDKEQIIQLHKAERDRLKAAATQTAQFIKTNQFTDREADTWKQQAAARVAMLDAKTNAPETDLKRPTAQFGLHGADIPTEDRERLERQRKAILERQQQKRNDAQKQKAGLSLFRKR